MSQNILITGGRGYLGGRIASYLQGYGGYHCKLGSRQKYGKPEWLVHGEISPMDFDSDASLDKVCHHVQVVIHLAALNHIECAKKPEEALKVNTLGTLRLLQAAQRVGVEKFIYFSTAHIYGSPLEGTISEVTLPRPVHPYSLTHKAAEDYVLAANDCETITGLVLRLSNGFGCPMDATADCWSLLVNDLCRQAVSTRSLKMHSTGQQRRDFVTLTDVQRAVLHAMNMKKEHVGNGVFNVGGDWSPRIIDVVKLIQKRCSVVLGFVPELICPEPLGSEPDSELEFCVDKLLSTGFFLKGQANDEIDTLLLFCKKSFGSNA